MQQVISQLEAELKTIVAAHGAADDQVPPVPYTSTLPADHEDRVRQRLAAIKKARAELKDRWMADYPEEGPEAEPSAGTQINFTDPDSHIMVTKNQGVQQAYNTQIVVDAQDGIIVEPVFGILKETLGFRQWSLRGLKKVTDEFALLVMAYNIRKLAAKLRQLGEAVPAVLRRAPRVAA